MNKHEGGSVTRNENSIAIVAMSCRFPGAVSVGQYWQNLLDGVESIQVESDPDGRVRARAELSGIEDFDYDFFGFSFKEAQLLDPQHRVLLECAWEVLEDASFHEQSDSIGVFCGAGPSSYFINNIYGLNAHDNAGSLYQSSESLAQFMATDKEFLASRIAYKLNCCGPAVNVQAACATSMFGVHAAIQALLLGECDAALVGAATISVPQSIPYYFEPGMPFSSDGHCRPFDAQASGTVFGSGAAVIGLKRFADALADGNHIHAVIRSVATNNDGAHRAGMSAPSVAGQARVICEALDLAGVAPADISYIEAHGTATPIGDPIEIKALATAFTDRDCGHTCYLGSVKGNIGHLGWSAGMAGLIKAVLIAQHKVIPPTLNFQQYNPQLYIEETPFVINRQPVSINQPHIIVGVSSFGLGGNNSHLILETAPPTPVTGSSVGDNTPWLIPISARDVDGLRDLCNAYRQFLETQADDCFLGFVSNLRYSKSTFQQRAYICVSDRSQAIEALAALSFNNRSPDTRTPRVGLMFSGQGAEHREMGRELYIQEALFKSELDAFNSVCREAFGADVADLLFDTRINMRIEQDIALSQPLTFALQVAMARLFLSHDITPVAVFGHSLGEYAAACISGVFSPEQGFRMLVQRSRLLDSLGDIGAMAVLGCDHACASGFIEKIADDLSIAALNGTINTVVSGTREAIERLLHNAQLAGVNASRLNISRPGHSCLLDPLLDSFKAYLDSVAFSPPSSPFISTLTGVLAGEEVATSQYWCRQLRETVNFSAGVASALDQGCTHLVELGPKAILSGLVLGDWGDQLNVLPIARGGQKDHQQYLAVLGELYQAGADVRFTAPSVRVPLLSGLPGYPFRRVRCWINASQSEAATSELIYQTVWQPLTDKSMDSRAANLKVLFLSLGEQPRDEVRYLDGVFKKIHRVALNRLVGACCDAIQNTATQAFAELWREYSDGLDRVYLDLRQLPDSDVKASISACAQTLSLMRSMTDRCPHICLLFATQACCDGDKTPGPVANSVVGMLRSLLLEEPGRKVTVLNFLRTCLPQSTEEAEPILLLPSTDELVVTIEKGQAYVPRLERFMEDYSSVEEERDQHYVLLGGAGGIGRKLIESLCAEQDRSVLVIGRSPNPNDALRELMVRHPGVLYFSFDLSSDQGQDDCAQWLHQASLQRATIFNLAVDLNDKLWGDVGTADLQQSFDAKCNSVLALYRLLSEQGTKVECVFNFSSATSILGNAGQLAYGAASAFLDAAHGTLFSGAAKVLTVNWGVWGDAGKLLDEHQRLKVLKISGLNSHSSERGIRFVRTLLGGPSRRVAYMNINERALGDRSRASTRFLECLAPKVSERDSKNQDNVATRLLACNDEYEVIKVLKAWLFSTVNTLVGLEPASQGYYESIKSHSFKTLGFDSLALVQLKNALNSQLGLQWSLERFHASRALSELFSDMVAHVNQPAWRDANKVRKESVLPKGQGALVSLQQARWISLIGQDYGLRIIPYRIHCPFDAEHCRKAMLQVLEEHPLLRTFFPGGRAVVKTPAQVLEGFTELYTDLAGKSAQQKTQEIKTLVRSMAQALPKPEENVTWAIHFVDIGESWFVALLGVQHLEFDGKSLTLMFDRFGECLYQLANDQPLTCINHIIAYADYAQRQQQYLHGQWRYDVGFFKGLYNAFKSPTVLPGHLGFSATAVRRSARHSVMIADANRLLSKMAAQHGFSVFNAILYVYAATMAEVIGCNQLMISAINSGRGLSEFNDVIGPFTSPLPVPITVHHEWLNGISMVARTLEAIQDYPLMHPTMMIDEVAVFSGMAHDSYFSDLGINFLNYRQSATRQGKVWIEGVEILGPIGEGVLSGANVEDMRRVPGLHLVVEIDGHDLRFNFWYHGQRFSRDEVKRWSQLMMRNLNMLLSAVREGNE
ncbi:MULTISPECIES: type I polyketide synthase [Pseudomonas]|uniref:type I polyketide synthase n=1 Tax=Pseudomonas TaxID=286 RepID=UPI001BE86F24|nr:MULTISPECIES: type I polyketide synthase [Pseudomonas]MBT2340710.1 acyltransferase domain-containing protein [Pseudomonas fluorescens]MCD4528850.1 acyltransferase domain-containing protein [Pseudomonas sp. C3-2018]